MNLQEAKTLWAQDKALLAEKIGVMLDGVTSYRPDEFKKNFQMAMDAQPTAQTDPNSAIMAMLTTTIDPEIFKILFSPQKAAKIFGEKRAGSWTDQTRAFPVVEHTGEVTSYGDYATSGRTGANTNFPQRQAYLFQTIKEYGDLELDRAGLMKINWASELDQSAANNMMVFQNTTYFFGVAGLACYGLLNDPNLGAPLTPATKANGGTTWFKNGSPNASANEVYNDILAIFTDIVSVNADNVDEETPFVLAMSPASQMALKFTNSFGINVKALLKDNFPNIRFETAVQYGVQTATNSQGNLGGNLVQMIVEKIQGQETGYCAFNEKMRSGPVIRDLSSFRQKITGGTWGSIVRMPLGFASMLGV